jgi:hypothetical protein
MHRWRCIIVLTYLLLRKFWTFVLLFLCFRESIMYTLFIHELCPSVLFNRIDFLIEKKKNMTMIMKKRNKTNPKRETKNVILHI